MPSIRRSKEKPKLEGDIMANIYLVPNSLGGQNARAAEELLEDQFGAKRFSELHCTLGSLFETPEPVPAEDQQTLEILLWE